MSLAPHLLPGSRKGYRFGNVEVRDHMQWDGLWDPYDNLAMGHCGEVCAQENDFTREAQDEYAITSYLRAQKAIQSGAFDRQVVPVNVKARRKEIKVERDEEPHSLDLERLGQLRPAFSLDGTITAANASSINDGAALLVLTSPQMCEKHGVQPIAKVLGHASYAHEPKYFTTAPVNSIRGVLRKVNLSPTDIDLYEINEAFSVVPMYAMSQLSLSTTWLMFTEVRLL